MTAKLENAKNIYLVFTPYHFLLTLIHANRKDSDFILMVDDNGKLCEYDSIGRRLHRNFDYINMANKKYKILSRQLRFSIGNRKNLDIFIRKSRSSPISNVYVFNDAIPAAQYLIKKLTGNATYIEDGSAPYNEHAISWSLVHRLKCWLAYGFGYHFVNVLGTSPLINNSLFLYPNLIRRENSILPYSHFETSGNYIEIIKKLAIEFYKFKTTKTPANSNSALILLPRLSAKEPAFIDELHCIIKNLDNLGWSIFLKSHPLDGNASKVFEITACCKFLPSNMPAEIIPGIIDSIKLIIGKETTSLMSIKKLFPDLKTINLVDEKTTQSRYQTAMIEAGVVISDAKELMI